MTESEKDGKPLLELSWTSAITLPLLGKQLSKTYIEAKFRVNVHRSLARVCLLYVGLF